MPPRPRKHYTLVMLSAAATGTQRVATAAGATDKDALWLLGYKKRGFGVHKWNGFGGKIESGETAELAAVREFKEECGIGLEPSAITKIGELHFEFVGKPVDMFVHVFRAHEHNGASTMEPIETDEMLPKWFRQDEIPYRQMWPDDEHWWPYMINSDTFHGYFRYGDKENILHFTLEQRRVFDDNVTH